MGAVVLLACLPWFAAPQIDPPDGKKIQEAVKKGVAFLKVNNAAHMATFSFGPRRMCRRDLVLWTYINAAVPPTDVDYQTLFQDMIQDKLECTYQVALQAMILEFLDRNRFQWRIQQCAQFLADNASPAGQWGYGAPSMYVELIKDPGKPGMTLPESPQNSKALKKVKVEKRRDGESDGDTSNSFFAALGIRACVDAGVVFPPGFIDKAIEGWKKFRVVDSWGYGNGVSDALPAPTASAVASLLTYGSIQGASLRKESIVASSVAKMGDAWSFGLDPRGAPTWNGRLFQFYGFYASEIAGLFLGADKFGTSDWYQEGAGFILRNQDKGGFWDAGGFPDHRELPQRKTTYTNNKVEDTCFAILFLTKGIRPLQDPPPKKK